jgi:hypothetical protein
MVSEVMSRSLPESAAVGKEFYRMKLAMKGW